MSQEDFVFTLLLFGMLIAVGIALYVTDVVVDVYKQKRVHPWRGSKWIVRNVVVVHNGKELYAYVKWRWATVSLDGDMRATTKLPQREAVVENVAGVFARWTMYARVHQRPPVVAATYSVRDKIAALTSDDN